MKTKHFEIGPENFTNENWKNEILIDSIFFLNEIFYYWPRLRIDVTARLLGQCADIWQLFL